MLVDHHSIASNLRKCLFAVYTLAHQHTLTETQILQLHPPIIVDLSTNEAALKSEMHASAYFGVRLLRVIWS